MAKKRKRSALPARKSGPTVRPENPFEQLYQHKKFDVLGKRFKGDSRKLIKSRADAVDKRSKSLLVEYKQLAKANTFLDNRFGEEDATMTAEDKALARFQKERLKEERGSRFALADDGDADTLTHLGRSLADTADFQQAALQGAADAGEEELPAELVDELHFGGFVRKATPGQLPEQDQPERRTKKEVMEEVMAKSKAFKAAKQQQREEDLTQTEALDDSFAALMQGGALAGMLKPGGRKQREAGAQLQPAETADAAYDRLRRELVYEPKGKVSVPEKAPEQLQETEHQQLAAAEKRRLKRMRSAEHDDDSADDVADAPAPAGGFAARRHKQKQAEAAVGSKAGPSGDALEDDFELDSGDEASGSGSELADEAASGSDSSADEDDESPQNLRGLSLEQRQQARAAGSHPLQQSFRQAAAQLLQKHAAKGKAGAAARSRADAALEPELDGEKPSAVNRNWAESVSGSDTESDTEAADGSDAESASESESKADPETDSESESGSELEPGSEPNGMPEASRAEAAAHGAKKNARQAEAAADLHGKSKRAKLDVSTAANGQREKQNVIAQTQSHSGEKLPETYAEFAERVAGLDAEQLGASIAAIRSRHAASLAANARHQLQVLYGLVLQHFAKVASRQPVQMPVLDVLMTHLLSMTPDVPFYAAMSARARLARAAEKLQAALTDLDAQDDNAAGGWPEVRTLLLLKLWAVLFPASDRKHAVLSPAALLIGSYLANCRPSQPYHLATGLFLCQLGLDYAAPAQRFMPEVLGFANTLLSSALPSSQPRHQLHHLPEPLRLGSLNGWSTAVQQAGVGRLRLSQCEPTEQQQAAASSEFKAAALLAAVRVLERAARECDESAGVPEALEPSLQLLLKLEQQACLPLDILAACKTALAAVTGKCRAVLSKRKPLQRSAAAKAPAVKLYNPRFEEDFVSGKDYDPDRERAEKRRLKRQVNKEQRGAVRELRKDAAFLHTAKEAEAAAAKRERMTRLRAGRSFMEQQAADMASGGQKGLWRKKKRK